MVYDIDVPLYVNDNLKVIYFSALFNIDSV